MPKFVTLTYEKVYTAKDEEEAERFASIHARQSLDKHLKIVEIGCLPDDKEPCTYGKLNRTCDGKKCKVCEREDWLQAMNEDASDERMGVYE